MCEPFAKTHELSKHDTISSMNRIDNNLPSFGVLLAVDTRNVGPFGSLRRD